MVPPIRLSDHHAKLYSELLDQREVSAKEEDCSLVRFERQKLKAVREQVMPSLGVFAAVFNREGRVLCVRHNYGTSEWGMPGGQVEPGEDPVTAIKREVLEETGIVAEITEFAGVYSAPYRDDLVLLFIGRVQHQTPWSPSDEIAERGFYPVTDLPTPMAANPRLRFAHVMAGARGLLCTLSEPGTPCAERSLPGIGANAN